VWRHVIVTPFEEIALVHRLRSGLLWMAALAGLALLTGLLLPGCSVGYVTRQSATHLRVMAARQPVDKAIAAGDIPPAWLEAIATIRSAKQFGVERLGLPAEDLYETIALIRPGPNWIVTACPRDALQPVTWWFPVAGRVAYRGYYDREDADRFAAGLRRKDLDVSVRPAAAFSTLGWFADPIRPAMLQGTETYLVDLVLHEATHGLLYLKGETDFNESFASFVAQAGTILYFRDAGCEDGDICQHLLDEAADAATFASFIEEVVASLNEFYAGEIPREEKVSGREMFFARAREDSRTLPWRRNGYAWFAGAPLDNAVLLSYRRYGSGQEVFADLVASCRDDLGLALQAMAERFAWSKLPRSQRREMRPADYLRDRLNNGPACLGLSLENTPADAPPTGNLQP
jgi:predicted aminopeptidase